MSDESNRIKPDEEDDGRSPFAIAMDWTSRITAISMEMVLPTLGGLWLDHRLGTQPLFLVVGAMIGFSIAMSSLVRLGKQGPKQKP
jgi:F0F1-type ATP synthase assembly protein I